MDIPRMGRKVVHGIVGHELLEQFRLAVRSRQIAALKLNHETLHDLGLSKLLMDFGVLSGPSKAA